MLYNSKNPHGGDIYGDKIILDYSANTNPFGTPEGVKKAIAEALDSIDRYPDPYCRKLVEALAKHENVPEEYVICGNGAAEVIYAYCEAIQAKTAVELAPTFAEYSLGLERTGTNVERYMLNKDNMFCLDEKIFDFLKQVKPEVLFLCHPNNPTGQIIEENLLLQIIACCKELGTRLFLDECFLDLSSEGRDVNDIVGENKHLFILKAFTKSYGMAGVRLGYGITADGKLLSEMSKSVQPWNVSTLAQAAGVAALSETKFLADTNNLIIKERAWLKSELENMGYWVSNSKTNYLLFEAEQNLATLLRTQGIAIRKCDNYYGLGAGWYRIAVRLHNENIRLIEAIKGINSGRKE